MRHCDPCPMGHACGGRDVRHEQRLKQPPQRPHEQEPVAALCLNWGCAGS